MENKSIKVIDEHNIDRVANVICAIDVDGSDYVVYSIERDSDNDNIFVSKLVKNINETSNVVNIDDSMEKDKISSLVKELIKYAVDNESLDQNDRKVSLPSGKVVNIIVAMIDKKEQNINVQKTYITTVKKAVTKVSEDFYKIESNGIDVGSQMDNIFPNFGVPSEKEVAPLPDIVPNLVETNKEETINTISEPQKIDSTIPNIINPVVENTPSTINNDLSNETSISQNIVSPVVNDIKIETVPTMESSVEHSQDLPHAVSPEPVPVIQSPVLEPQILPSSIPSSPIPSSEPVIDKVENPTSTFNFTPPVSDNKIVFDGSKESNLNEALGEVSTDKILATDNVEPIREFGVDDVKETSLPNSAPSVDTLSVPDVQSSNISSTIAGFANNKFFMVIAILFFVSACVFLGYEAFRYFQLTK